MKIELNATNIIELAKAEGVVKALATQVDPKISLKGDIFEAVNEIEGVTVTKECSKVIIVVEDELFADVVQLGSTNLTAVMSVVPAIIQTVKAITGAMANFEFKWASRRMEREKEKFMAERQAKREKEIASVKDRFEAITKAKREKFYAELEKDADKLAQLEKEVLDSL